MNVSILSTHVWQQVILDGRTQLIGFANLSAFAAVDNVELMERIEGGPNLALSRREFLKDYKYYS